MTDEELVKQGRAFERDLNNGFPMTCEKGRVIQEMASRIEALTAKLAEMVEDGNWAYVQAALEDNATELTECEAKLAKAMEGLRAVDALDPEGMIDGCSQSASRGLVLRMGEISRATLAEIEGENK
jgi:hypothetical protein